jgi:hypothetical protein
VVDDSADSSPPEGTSNYLEKYGVGAPEIAGDGRDRWGRRWRLLFDG